MTSRQRIDGLSTEEMVREIYDRVIGDGTEENPGLTMRIDRVERDVSAAKWLGGSAIATVVGLGCTWIWAKLTGR